MIFEIEFNYLSLSLCDKVFTRTDRINQRGLAHTSAKVTLSVSLACM